MSASGATTMPMSRPSATMPAASRGRRDDASLHADQQVAHWWQGGDQADRIRYLAGPDRDRNVLAVYVDLRRSRIGHYREARFAKPGQHGCRIGDVDAVTEHPPGQRPVHRAGVEVVQAEIERDPAGCGRLARPCRAVDGNDQAGLAASGKMLDTWSIPFWLLIRSRSDATGEPASLRQPARRTAARPPPVAPTTRPRRPADPASARCSHPRY